jgi:Transglycosylase SLT domain
MERSVAAIKCGMSRVVVSLLSVALVVCVEGALASAALAGPHDALIVKHATANGVPETLVRRVIYIESRGNAGLSHAGNYGLMQIRLGTARSLGYSGDIKGLLDPDTNLTYAVKYLAGAYRMAGCNADRAIHYYQHGYYGVRRVKCEVVMVPAQPADVLKPRVVRTETIGMSVAAPEAARPVGAFEPARITAKPITATLPMPMPSPVRIQLASIPLPPVRPEFEAAPEKTKDVKAPVQPAHKRARANTNTNAKTKAAAASSATSTKSDDDPTGVVSALKKFVASGNPSHRRAAPDTSAASPQSPQPPL